MNVVGAKMEYVDIDAGSVFHIGDDDQITVRSSELCHPDKAFGFRIEYAGKSMVYATDTENLPKPDSRLVELAYGADLLIHDAQYTTDEYYGEDGNSRKNWGHSTPAAAAETALAANVEKLVLFHHDPYHDDETVAQMFQSAAAIFPNTVVASENMMVALRYAMEPAGSYLWETNMLRVYS